MKKIFLSLIIILLAVASYFAIGALHKNKNNISSVLPVIEKEVISESTDNYELDISYPLISNISNKKIEDDLNGIFLNTVIEASDSFKKDVSDNSIKIENVKSEYTYDYEIVSSSDQFISIKFVEFYYIAGMAHPQTIYHGFNYDILNGKEISISDFFNSGSDFLSKLASISKAEIKNQLEPQGYYFEDMADPGAAPTMDNYSEFVFDKDGITIIFNQNMVAAYVVGPIFIKISYSDLSDVNKDSELLKRIF